MNARRRTVLYRSIGPYNGADGEECTEIQQKDRLPMLKTFLSKDARYQAALKWVRDSRIHVICTLAFMCGVCETLTTWLLVLTHSWTQLNTFVTVDAR